MLFILLATAVVAQHEFRFELEQDFTNDGDESCLFPALTRPTPPPAEFTNGAWRVYDDAKLVGGADWITARHAVTYVVRYKAMWSAMALAALSGKSTAYIFTFNPRFRLFVGCDGRLSTCKPYLLLGTSLYELATTSTLAWHTVVVAVQNSSSPYLKAFYDGAIVYTRTTATPDLMAVTSDLSLGTDTPITTPFLSVFIDYFYVLDGYLTASDVDSLSLVPPPCTPSPTLVPTAPSLPPTTPTTPPPADVNATAAPTRAPTASPVAAPAAGAPSIIPLPPTALPTRAVIETTTTTTTTTTTAAAATTVASAADDSSLLVIVVAAVLLLLVCYVVGAALALVRRRRRRRRRSPPLRSSQRSTDGGGGSAAASRARSARSYQRQSSYAALPPAQQAQAAWRDAYGRLEVASTAAAPAANDAVQRAYKTQAGAGGHSYGAAPTPSEFSAAANDQRAYKTGAATGSGGHCYGAAPTLPFDMYVSAPTQHQSMAQYVTAPQQEQQMMPTAMYVTAPLRPSRPTTRATSSARVNRAYHSPQPPSIYQYGQIDH